MESESAAIAPTPKKLPYSGWWPLVAGALVGVALRLVFSGKPGFPFAAMNSSFILFTPAAVGVFTVYVAERTARRSWTYYIVAAGLANLLFVSGTMAILIEGLICAVVIAPLFFILGSIGGLAMGVVCRTTNWPRHAAYGCAVLPLMLGAFAPHVDGDMRIVMTERQITIPAAPSAIWSQLLDVRDIQPEEVGQAWMYRIGVPLPKSGVTQITSTNLVRHVTMGKSIRFDQVADAWERNRYVRWNYRFDSDSFPPRALDDHVKIGGHYFDLIDTEYTLVPVNKGTTNLTIRMHYRVSTEFNWYALPVARFLIGNFEDVILGFYRQRAISVVSPDVQSALLSLRTRTSIDRST